MNTTLSKTNSNTPLIESEPNIPALLYRRGSPPQCTNIECLSKLQCYAYPDGWQIGIWAEGIHIRVLLADILKLVGFMEKSLESE